MGASSVCREGGVDGMEGTGPDVVLASHPAIRRKCARLSNASNAKTETHAGAGNALQDFDGANEG